MYDYKGHSCIFNSFSPHYSLWVEEKAFWELKKVMVAGK